MYCHHLPLHYNWKPHQLRHKKLYQHLQCHHLYLDLWQCWSRRRTVCLYRMDSHTTTHCAALFPVRNIRIMRLFKNIQWIWTRTQQVGVKLIQWTWTSTHHTGDVMPKHEYISNSYLLSPLTPSLQLGTVSAAPKRPLTTPAMPPFVSWAMAATFGDCNMVFPSHDDRACMLSYAGIKKKN